MKIKYFLQLITLFLGLFCGLQVWAHDLSPSEAEHWATNKGDEILNILTSTDIESKYEQLDNILLNDVDLDHAARFAVGKYWQIMTDNQRTEYVDLFKKYTSSLYKSYPLTIDKGEVRFTVDNIVSTPKATEVHCTVFIKKLESNVTQDSQGGIPVIFVIKKGDDGKIRVRDLKISESSFLISYRERFQKMIHQDNDDDIEWFLEDLEMHIEDINEKNTKNLDEQEF